MLIDGFRRDDLVSALGTAWRGVSDRVMGGISQETLRVEEHDGRRCLRLSGHVRLENNGGFIQIALDLSPEGANLDASSFTGLRLLVYGNGERYSVHLRTADIVRPWQSYRAHFEAPPEWREIRLPFADFKPYRLEAPLDLTRLRRIGVVAIGRAFFADLRLGEIGFYS
ncbi:MAG: CIA30 family protein [Gammaproteobacteria bacterium]|nr:CIA30 family protein [Gammaproteobacteria bacterium]